MLRFRRHLVLASACVLLALTAIFATPQQAPERIPLPDSQGYRGPRLPTLSADVDQTRLTVGEAATVGGATAELVSVEQVWSQAPHNGFTDLIFFRGRWYCALREGSARVSADGAVRILSSADGAEWLSAARFTIDGADLRDPKLSVTSDERLMLSAADVRRGPSTGEYQTLSWYALDGRNWGLPFKIGDPNMWLWRVSWHRGNAYSMGYSTAVERYLRMYVSPGGLRFQAMAEKIHPNDTPTEAELLFDQDNNALSLLRCDGGPGMSQLGRSRPPYRGWEWRDLGVRLTGPSMARLPDGRIVAAGQLEDAAPHTSIGWLDEDAATFTEILALPSGGDAGYPGLEYRDGLLWVSYHSSHEGQTAVYVAKVKLPETK